MNTSGTVITLAWPETPVVAEGKWYGFLMKKMGFIKDGLYKVGHAAILLINHHNGEIHYMDFGRYHTPYQQGRVRDKFTDPDVTIRTVAIIKDARIVNLEEVLKEISLNEATHGLGKIYAGIKAIPSFNKVFSIAKKMQDKGAINYGPISWRGSNCSRFVAQITIGQVGFLRSFLLIFSYTGSPTPFSNVKIINDFGYYYVYQHGVLCAKKNRLFFFKK